MREQSSQANLCGFCDFVMEVGVFDVNRERSEISLYRLQGNVFKPLTFLTLLFWGDKGFGDRMDSNALTESR